MEFPAPRVMKDMLLLPPGDIILINGATYGSAGWDEARNPDRSTNPVLSRRGSGDSWCSEPDSQNVPLHSSALARWQSVSGREQPVPNVLQK
jgi:hypothetical protein